MKKSNILKIIKEEILSVMAEVSNTYPSQYWGKVDGILKFYEKLYPILTPNELMKLVVDKFHVNYHTASLAWEEFENNKDKKSSSNTGVNEQDEDTNPVKNAATSVSDQRKQLQVDPMKKQLDGINKRLEPLNLKKAKLQKDIGSLEAQKIKLQMDIDTINKK